MRIAAGLMLMAASVVGIAAQGTPVPPPWAFTVNTPAPAGAAAPAAPAARGGHRAEARAGERGVVHRCADA